MMGIDELKLILETVEGVSDSAVWVVCLWFGVGILKQIIDCGVALIIALGFYKLVVWIFRSFTFVGEVLREFGIDSYPEYSGNQADALKKIKNALSQT